MCDIVAVRSLASYDMPEKKEVYLVLAIRRNFSIVDFDMHIDRSFIFCNRSIKVSMKEQGDKILHVYEDASLRAEEETNKIKKIEEGKAK